VSPPRSREKPRVLRVLRAKAEAVEVRAPADRVEQESDGDVGERGVDFSKRQRELESSEVERAALEEEAPMLEDVAAVDFVVVGGDEALVPGRQLIGPGRPLPSRKAPLAPGFRQPGVETVNRFTMGRGIGNDLQKSPRVPNGAAPRTIRGDAGARNLLGVLNPRVDTADAPAYYPRETSRGSPRRPLSLTPYPSRSFTA
jgi:hypothetical protein